MTYTFETLPNLETERLRLRMVQPDDAAAWQAVFAHRDVTRYLADFDKDESVQEIIQWAHGVFAKKTGFRLAITRKPDDTMIGSCGYHLYNAHARCAEIGYELHHDYWRQGIMTEALHALLQFGFVQMNLHRIEAEVTVGNEASAGLLTHLGFTLEGTWRDKEFARGRFWSLWQFSLLEAPIGV